MSTPRTLLETSVHRPAMTQVVGCLGSIPIILAVVVVVNLFIGESQLPREIRGTTPWFALGTLISGLIAGAIWYRSRIRLAVVELEGARYLEIDDPSAPIVLKGPFELRYGWFPMHMPKGGTMTVLVLAVYQDGVCHVSLSETWGALYGTPDGWPGGFSHPGLAQAAYEAAGGSFLIELLELLEDA